MFLLLIGITILTLDNHVLSVQGSVYADSKLPKVVVDLKGFTKDSKLPFFILSKFESNVKKKFPDDNAVCPGHVPPTPPIPHDEAIAEIHQISQPNDYLSDPVRIIPAYGFTLPIVRISNKISLKAKYLDTKKLNIPTSSEIEVGPFFIGNDLQTLCTILSKRSTKKLK